MTKSLGTLTAHSTAKTMTLCHMIRIDCRNGTTVALTDHDQVINYDLGDGAVDYSPSSGVKLSNIVTSINTDAANFELAGPIDDTFTRVAILGKVFHSARVRVFLYDHEADTLAAALIAGKASSPRIEGPAFVMEVRNQADIFNQTIGRVLTPYCTHDYGDARCGLTPSEYTASVTSVTNAFKLNIDLAGSHPDAFFNTGSLVFTSGELVGVEMEIFSYVGASGAVELFAPLPTAPSVSDTLTLKRGCSKLLESTDGSIITCLSEGNVLNFGGHPDVPSTEQYLKIASPGQGGDGGFSGGQLGGIRGSTIENPLP